MNINEEEAWTIFRALGDEDGEITEEEEKLEKRIRQEFPAINEKLKKNEHRDHLWKYEVENDKKVKEARERSNRLNMESLYRLLDDLMKVAFPPVFFSRSSLDGLLDDLMKTKKMVLDEILEKEYAK